MIKLPRPVLRYDISEFLGDGWIAQRKWDGVRLAVVYGDDGRARRSVTKGGKEFKFTPISSRVVVAPNTIIDGELIGINHNWESALRALAEEDSEGHWIPFGIVDSDLDFGGQDSLLRKWKLRPTESYSVERAWDECRTWGWEGIVVRKVDEPSICFKVKFREEIDAVVVRGKMFVLDGQRPMLLGSLSAQDGKYRVAHEGLSRSGKLRAPFVVGPARSTCSAAQLDGIRKR